MIVSAPVQRRAKLGGAKVLRRSLRVVLLGLASILIVFAVLSACARIALPMVAGYKTNFEARISDYLGRPVVIGELHLGWHGFGPQLRAIDVSIVEPSSHPVSLTELLIDLNLIKSAARGTPVINELTLVGAELTLEYDADGKLRLQGLSNRRSATPAQGSAAVGALPWLLNAKRLGFINTRVAVIDSTRQRQEILLEQLNVRVENNANVHQLRIDTVLPAGMGGALELGLDITGPASNWAASSGNFYLKADDIETARWPVLGKLQTARKLDGTVQLELWGQWGSQQLQNLRGHVVAKNIHNPESATQILDQVSADIAYQHSDSGWQLHADAVNFQLDDYHGAVKGFSYQSYRNAQNDWQLEASGDQFPLHFLQAISTSLDSNAEHESWRGWLVGAQPSGELRNWQVSLAQRNGEADLNMEGTFSDLSVHAANRIAGVKNLSGSFSVVHSVGSLKLHSRQFLLDWPASFSTPLSLAGLDADLQVDLSVLSQPKVSGQLAVQDNAVDATARLKLQLMPNESPHLDVQGRFSISDLAQIKHYLPTKLIPKSATHWLKTAVVGGNATNGQLLFFGQLADFPFVQRQGVFKVGFDLEETELAYLPGWPSAEELHGHVDINAASMSVRVNGAQLNTLRITRASAQIDSLFHPLLKLEATGDDVLQHMIDFANTGPLRTLLQPALSDASATGRAQMDLQIEVPLHDNPTAQNLQLKGSLFLRDNSLAFSRADLTLDNATGAVGFSESGIAIRNLQGQLFGQAVSLNGKTQGQGDQQVTELSMSGALAAEKLLDHYAIPLTRFVAGSSQWQVTLNIPHSPAMLQRQGIALLAKSDLVGTHVLMPAPLFKSSAVSIPLQLSATLRNEQTSTRWQVHYGQSFKAQILAQEGNLRSLTIRLGGGGANKKLFNGIRIDGTVDEFAIDAWATSIADVIEDLPESKIPEKIIPLSADIHVASLLAGVESLGAAQLRANSDGQYLNAVIDNAYLRGNIRYPRAHWRKDKPALVRIAHADMRFIDALQSAPDTADSAALDPRILPPIEARVASFRWGELNLKDVNLRTSPTVSGLHIDTLGFANQSTQLIGQGYWRLRDPQAVNPKLAGGQVTHLSLTLQSDDVGNGLAHVGYSGAMDEGEGTVSAYFNWPGPAYSPDLKQITGDVQIDLKRGRILKVDPGAARLVGLFAIQTLPRRLSLDFKDLVYDGFDYQSIVGKVDIGGGIANARLVQINGPVGVIDIIGESNLLTKHYDQRITVLPRVSAALPIIGAIAGGASAGIGALIAGGFLKAIGIDFDRIGLREYKLTGSWESPELEIIPYNATRQ